MNHTFENKFFNRFYFQTFLDLLLSKDIFPDRRTYQKSFKQIPNPIFDLKKRSKTAPLAQVEAFPILKKRESRRRTIPRKTKITRSKNK